MTPEELFAVFPIYQGIGKNALSDYRFVCLSPTIAAEERLKLLQQEHEAFVLCDKERNTVVGFHGIQGPCLYEDEEISCLGKDLAHLHMLVKSDPTNVIHQVYTYVRSVGKLHTLYQLVSRITKIGLKVTYASCKGVVSPEKEGIYCQNKINDMLVEYGLLNFYGELQSFHLRNIEDERKFITTFLKAGILLSQFLPLEVICFPN